MAKQRNAVRVGMFVLFCIAAVICIVIAIVGGARVFQRYQSRTVAFTLADNVGGLNIGDDVRIGGFKVGEIESIEVNQPSDDSTPPRIIVTFSIPEKYKLRQGYDLHIEGTLTGQSWLNIDSMGAGEPLADADQLIGRPSAMSQFTAALSEMAPEVKQVVTQVRTVTLPHADAALSNASSLLAETRIKEEIIIPDVQVVLQRARDALGTINQFLGPSTTDFHGAVADLHQITTGLRQREPDLLNSASTLLHRVNNLTAKLNDTLVDLRATIVNLKDSTGVVRSVVIGNRGKLEGIISSLKATGDNLKAASEEIRRSPWRLLYKPSDTEMANLNVYDSARAFSDGAASLDDASTALRDALSDPNADPELIRKLNIQLDQSFAHFQEVEAKLWKSVQN